MATSLFNTELIAPYLERTGLTMDDLAEWLETEAIIKVLKAWKRDVLDVPASFNQIESTFSQKPSRLGDTIYTLISLAQRCHTLASSSPAEDDDAFVATTITAAHISALIAGASINGALDFVDFAVRLLLTVFRDLHRHPKSSFFKSLLRTSELHARTARAVGSAKERIGALYSGPVLPAQARMTLGTDDHEKLRFVRMQHQMRKAIVKQPYSPYENVGAPEEDDWEVVDVMPGMHHHSSALPNNQRGDAIIAQAKESQSAYHSAALARCARFQERHNLPAPTSSLPSLIHEQKVESRKWEEAVAGDYNADAHKLVAVAQRERFVRMMGLPAGQRLPEDEQEIENVTAAAVQVGVVAAAANGPRKRKSESQLEDTRPRKSARIGRSVQLATAAEASSSKKLESSSNLSTRPSAAPDTLGDQHQRSGSASSSSSGLSAVPSPLPPTPPGFEEAMATAAASRKQHKRTRGASWSSAEDAACIAAMEAVKREEQAGEWDAREKRVGGKDWRAVECARRMKDEFGFMRTAIAVKNQWTKRLKGGKEGSKGSVSSLETEPSGQSSEKEIGRGSEEE